MSDKASRMAVIGAGTMGHGIAQVAALSGLRVTMCDVSKPVLDLARRKIGTSLEEAISRGKATPEDRDGALERLVFTTDIEACASDADVIVEAVPEQLDLKRRVFSLVSATAPPTALIATNTSSLSVDELSKTVDRPEQFLGLHFFNPVPKMKLLEVVRGQLTSEQTVERALALGRRLGKVPIVVRNAPGFASSRLGIALGLEAIRMVEQEVASPADIDTAMELGYRHPMGPLRLTDLVGLDVRLAIAEGLHEKLGEVFRPPELLRKLVAEGKLGRKSGEGFYSY
ncbi:3-hydroxyacyl-CoA dehydrogenase family protein [Planctomycetota bacterium]